MADMSVSGIASGVDWDSMMEAILEKARKPAYVQLDKRDKLDQKKTALQEFQVALQAVQSSLSPLKLASTFKAKQVDIERLDRTGSYKNVLTASVNADAAINVYEMEVLQLAKKQTNRSDQFVTGTLPSSILGGNSYFYVNAGGKKVRVDIASSDTLSSLATKINANLQANVPPVGITASVVDGRLILNSNVTGLETTKLSATLRRSASGNDLLEFPVNPSDTGAGTYTLNAELGGVNGGTITIKRGSSTYTEGVDFDIVSGSEIRWRDYKLPYVTAGDAYSLTYTAGANETYTIQATRSATESIDRGVLTGVDVSSPSYSSSRVDVSVGGQTLVQGTDYRISGRDIIWLNSAYNGVDYEIQYTTGPSGGETFDVEFTRSNIDATGLASSAFAGKTVRIQGAGANAGKIYTQGVDFDVVADPSNASNSAIRWRKESGYIAPAPGEIYDIQVLQSNGAWTSYAGQASSADALNMTQLGFTPDPSTITVADPGGVFSGSWGNFSYGGQHVIVSGSDVSVNGYTNITAGGNNEILVNINWTPTSSSVARTDLPQYYNGTDSNNPDYNGYIVEYTYNANTFSLSDDGNGVLAILGLDQADADHYTAAQDAVILLDGERVTRSSNYIGESYGNELIKGMTIELKGAGLVSLDVSQDAEQAVTAVQNFLTAYNDVLTWIQTRLTEKAVDESKKATLDSDDFRMRWGVLNGSALLRNTKDGLRYRTSRIYAVPFTQRSSSKAIYGAMSQNGIVNPGTFTVTVGTRTLSVAVDPADTLTDIAAKINSPTVNGGEKNPLIVDATENGVTRTTVYAKAVVENGKIRIEAGTDEPVSLSGNAILTALGLNYQYTTLSQIGIKLSSDGTIKTQGQTGELEFDTSVFMTALENNADDVSMVMTNFASEMQTYMDDLLKSSQKEIATGVTAAQGAVAREINAIDSEIQSIDKYLTEFDKRLQNKQEALFKQFSAAETSLAKLIQQANWLASVTAQLSSSGTSSASA